MSAVPLQQGDLAELARQTPLNFTPDHAPAQEQEITTAGSSDSSALEQGHSTTSALRLCCPQGSIAIANTAGASPPVPARPPQLVPISVQTLRANRPTQADYDKAKAEYDNLFDPQQAALLQEQYREKLDAIADIRDQWDTLERRTKRWDFAASFLGVFWGAWNVASVGFALESKDWKAKTGRLQWVEISAMIGNVGVLLASTVSVVLLIWQSWLNYRKSRTNGSGQQSTS